MTPEHKELTTLAAKAMGYTVAEVMNSHLIVEFGEEYFRWNPLTSLADCFFMECQLEIDVIFRDNLLRAVSNKPDNEGYFTNTIQADEFYGTNKQAARMLASTRVAAEIGRRCD